jgi:hypothetical protein
MKKPLFVFICIMAVVFSCEGLALGTLTVPGGVVSTYAYVDYPGQIAFGSQGFLYTGYADNDTQNGYVRQIAPGGAPVRNYGNHGFYDADAVAVDADGIISGTKGTVLVGCGYPGQIYGILPTDESVVELFTQMSLFIIQTR